MLNVFNLYSVYSCLYEIIYCTFLPRDCKQITTEFRFCLSQRSTVWKVSCAGTPNALAASRKAFIFSIHLKARDVLLIFFTEPSLISFTNLVGKQRGNMIVESISALLYLQHSKTDFFGSFLINTCTAECHPSESRKNCPYPRWYLYFRR